MTAIRPGYSFDAHEAHIIFDAARPERDQPCRYRTGYWPGLVMVVLAILLLAATYAVLGQWPIAWGCVAFTVPPAVYAMRDAHTHFLSCREDRARRG